MSRLRQRLVLAGLLLGTVLLGPPPHATAADVAALAQTAPDITDTWYVGGYREQPMEVQQAPDGNSFTVWNTRRQYFEGRFTGSNALALTMPGGELTGLLAGLTRIDWSDGSFWSRPTEAISGLGGAGFVGGATGAYLRLAPAQYAYRVGQLVRVCFTVPASGRVVLTDLLPDGSGWELVNGPRDAGETCVDWQPGPIDGRECLRLVHRVTLLEEKCFLVRR